MINKLRDFLNKEGVLKEYCDAVEYITTSQLPGCAWYDIISGLFSWSDANHQQRNEINWNRISNRWEILYCRDYDTLSGYEDKIKFLKDLRKGNKKIQLLNQIKYYKDTNGRVSEIPK